MRDSIAPSLNPICALADILPDSGVCALVDGEQVAVFRVDEGDSAAVYAIGNLDSNSHAAVLSRGIVGNLGERLVVASPIYKQHFDLRTGECLEAPQHSVPAWRAAIVDGRVWVGR
jgi:nitrite reductase (NADH) small subunit